jgi:hypothetical protein
MFLLLQDRTHGTFVGVGGNRGRGAKGSRWHNADNVYKSGTL